MTIWWRHFEKISYFLYLRNYPSHSIETFPTPVPIYGKAPKIPKPLLQSDGQFEKFKNYLTTNLYYKFDTPCRLLDLDIFPDPMVISYQRDKSR